MVGSSTYPRLSPSTWVCPRYRLSPARPRLVLTLLPQVEMTGSSFFDYIHQADHQELADQLGVSLARPDGSPESPRREGEEGGAGQQGPVPPIPDGKPCKW